MYKAFVAFILIIINFLVQSSIAPHIAVGHGTINFIIILVVSVALIRGRIEGAVIGFMIGLLVDIFFSPAVGFYALAYMYTGFITGIFNRGFYKEAIVIPMLIIGIADFSYNFVVYFFTYLLRGRLDFNFYLTKLIIPEAILTAFVSILLYRVYLMVNRIVEARLKKREESFDKL